VKRRELVRPLEQHGCELLREGANQSTYVNRAAGKTSAVSRHSEINDDLANKICKDLSVPLKQAQSLITTSGASVYLA
jgi:mRNA interferase HicA